MTTTLVEQTYLPAASTDLGPASQFLMVHDSGGAPRYALCSKDDGQEAVLPPEVHQALVQVVQAMLAGRAVTVAPHSMMLTTQQAADLLGVSRPTVVKLIDSNDIPGQRTSHRRQVALRDVLAYRDRRKAEQYAALDATSAELFDEDDPVAVRAGLKQARRVIAERRRQ